MIDIRKQEWRNGKKGEIKRKRGKGETEKERKVEK